MTLLRSTLCLIALAVFFPTAARAQEQPSIEVKALTEEGQVTINPFNKTAMGTNGVLVRYGNAVMTAETVSVDLDSGETTAEGRVRIQQDDMIWAGERVTYNFRTRQMRTEQYRTGKFPVFATGRGLEGDITNHIYTARSSRITTDDVATPFQQVRASSVTIVPGKYIVAHNAVLYLGKVPVFYFPYYKRSLAERDNHWTFIPGYRTKFGGYLLSTYDWTLNETLDGALHTDYRTRRGPGVGPDLNLHMGRWGDVSARYYYLRDFDPGYDDQGYNIPTDRQRADFSYKASPFTNFTALSRVRYLGDELIVHDFFESEHRENPQPTTFLELNQAWSNFSLDLYSQVRVNDFLETVERLPEIKLTGFRQQIGNTPFYYESESSAGYYRRLFAQTNNLSTGKDFEAARADTYHQITLPWTFFNWLNITPRVGGRYTYYSEADGDGAITAEESRGVFNTGAEVSFKASRLWAGVQNGWFQLDGLRHIIEPSVNYVFAPEPHVRPAQLPQFDYELASLHVLPIEYPDYNAIDSIDSQNVLRVSLRNKLQTKRSGRVEDLLRWDAFVDLRLDPNANQSNIGDISSELVFQPRSWLSFESFVRYNTDNDEFRVALHEVTLSPNDRWSWSVGHWYTRDDFSGTPTELGEGSSLIRSSMFYRLSDNWGFRAAHDYDIKDGRMQEQLYSIYRDLRSWTAALSVRLRDNLNGKDEFTVALTLSLKAAPRYGVGDDAVKAYRLLGR